MQNVSILNVGHGDTKLTFDPGDPAERKRAKIIVADMLKLGYAVCLREGDRWVRATRFDPAKGEYLIQEAKRKKPAKRVAAESVKSIAVARSAGGMSMQTDSIEMENLRSFDRLRPLREQLRDLADRAGEWAGIPMPLEDSPLVVEPKYPFAPVFERDSEIPSETAPKIRNRFYSTRYGADVLIWENEDGHIEFGPVYMPKAAIEIQTLGAAVAWGIEQEAAALDTLRDLISHHAFKTYLLTGSFLESSKRSGMTYMFRKLRPTLALRSGETEVDIIAALCMHPIAYYAESWAGAMCPTDDVIAHLTLMRADEHFYWRRCNQHPAYRPEAGL